MPLPSSTRPITIDDDREGARLARALDGRSELKVALDFAIENKQYEMVMPLVFTIRTMEKLIDELC